MAKKIKMGATADPLFENLVKNLSSDERLLLKNMGIKSIDGVISFLEFLGFDTEKLFQKLKEEDVESAKNINYKDYLHKDDNHPTLFKLLESLSKEDDEEGDDDEDYEDEDYEDEEEDDDYEDDYEDDEEDDYEDEDDFMYGDMPTGLLLGEECEEYHLRVRLNNAPVKIWRELVVPSNISLELLAQILIESMGWENCHLHQFKKGNYYYISSEEYEESKNDWLSPSADASDANTVSLRDVLKKKSDRMVFEYDYGDGWEHDVWVKGIRQYAADERPEVRLVKGQGACPPEDCGGVWGYSELLELRTKKHKSRDDRERLDWYGIDKDYDPDFFAEWTKDDVDVLWEDVVEEIEKRKSVKEGESNNKS